ncbi:ZN574 protein, partial [Smithornis capensis]|nr:ZN574 protein [Smithornis capensis]
MSLPEETLLLVEHRYVCSECSHLSQSLEEALLHHQHHLEPPPAPAPEFPPEFPPPEPEPSQYQCLECGMLLVTPGQLLEHQELHIKLLGAGNAGNPGNPEPPKAPNPGGIHFECPECRALFQSQDLWLQHRQGHRNSGRVDLDHSYRKPEDGEPDGGGIPAGMPAGMAADDGAVQLLLYECGECLQLFQSPKDFLEHQVTHLAAPAAGEAPQIPAEAPDPPEFRCQECQQLLPS